MEKGRKLPKIKAVHTKCPHIVNRGDGMGPKYNATYKFGKTTVHIVAPPPISDEEKEEILREYDRAFWAAWKSLSIKERLRINAECKVGRAE